MSALTNFIVKYMPGKELVIALEVSLTASLPSKLSEEATE